MKEEKFILCTNCRSKIYFGEYACCYKDYYGVYCSDGCFANALASVIIVTEDECYNRRCTVYTKSGIEDKKKDIEMQIEELNKQLADLNNLT